MLNLSLCHWSSQLFDLRVPSSTDVPALLLNQASEVSAKRGESTQKWGKFYRRPQAETCTFSDLSLAFSSGIPIAISRSKRPARRRAGSSESGLLVAPITSTWASGLLFRSDKKIGKEPYRPLPDCHEKAPTRSLGWQNIMEYGPFATSRFAA